MAKGRKRRNKGSQPRVAKASSGLAAAMGAMPPPAAPPPADPPAAPAAPAAAAPAASQQARLVVAGATDVGRKRDTNQDSFLVDEDLRLFVVADGMGGHAGGGTASRLAVETIQSEVRKSRSSRREAFETFPALEDSALPEVLRDAVDGACLRIFEEARATPSLAGMGTTATILLLHGRHAFVAHVGDSRIYLIRGGDIHQVSEDHSLVNEQIKAGVLTPEEARHSQFKNVITRSVGFEEDVLVDLMGLAVEKGDTFIICCDGLSNLVEDHEIAEMVRDERVEDLPLRLIGLANDRGGDDNITVIAVRIADV